MMPTWWRLARPVAAAAALLAAIAAAQAQADGATAGAAPGADAGGSGPRAATAAAPQQVVIIGTTLLPGSGVPLHRLAANAQKFSGAELRSQGSLTLTDFLDANATGVTVNAAQGNPYQPDVQVRGFSASPLLGTPQGISVFVDGVRVNEPFGDAVNWDLIPAAAIARIDLVPGSNPAYGLNTLGGAIVVTTRSGSSAYPDGPGGAVTLWGGSFGRRTLGVETGGRAGAWDWFVAADSSDDHGWALHNPSRVRQAFAKVGWQDDRTHVDVSLQAADNRLEGTQTLPPGFDDPRQAYTWPDLNRNRLGAVVVNASRALDAAWLVSGNAYVRRLGSRNVSSNVVDDPDDAPAANDTSAIAQWGRGAAVQFTHTAAPAAGSSRQLVFGASIDAGRARYTRASQPATFTADRGTVALADYTPEVDADASTRHAGLFATAVIGWSEHWALTLALRHNRTAATIADRSGTAPALNGSHRFARANPAIGLTFNPSGHSTVYASYNEGMRAPTAIELTCADPAAPCKLPNNFVADPPLRKVVSKNVEFGARAADGPLQGSVALFATELHDDLQFVSSSGLATNAGYFQNVGVTRRVGLEFGVGARWGRLAATLHYSVVDATYRTGFVENSPSNSTADAVGSIAVPRGARLPGVPRQALKLRLEAGADTRWSTGMNVAATSGFYARGDENNADANGRIGGHAVVSLDTRFRATPRTTLLARVDNVFDRDYSTFGVLGQNVFAGPDHAFDRGSAQAAQFRGHAAPRGAWAGVEVKFD